MYIKNRIKGTYIKEVGIINGKWTQLRPRMVNLLILAARWSMVIGKLPEYILCASENGTRPLTEILLLLHNLTPMWTCRTASFQKRYLITRPSNKNIILFGSLDWTNQLLCPLKAKLKIPSHKNHFCHFCHCLASASKLATFSWQFSKFHLVPKHVLLTDFTRKVCFRKPKH